MPSDQTPVQVVKLGGSLLGWPETPARLADLLAQPAVSRPLLVVGGGLAADIVRDWQQLHHFDEPTAHALAVDAMTFNAGLLAAVLSRATLVSNRDEALSAWTSDRWPILDCSSFLPREEPAQPLELPHSWEATSDAIAAWVTLAWPASRLLLLKSTELPTELSPSNPATPGLVDECLLGWLSRLPPVDWINLRAATPRPTRWHNPADQPVL